MMRRMIALVSLALVLMLGPAAPAADPSRPEVRGGPAAQGYGSPREAYEAYRRALDKDDWRTAFHCFTPAARDDQVFATFDGATFRAEEPKVAAAMKKYGLDLDTVLKEYTKQYRDKHGVDLEKLEAERARRYHERMKKYLDDLPKAANAKDGLVTVPAPAEAQPEPSVPPLVAVPQPAGVPPEPPVPAIWGPPMPAEEEPEPSMPPIDYELLRDVVLRLVADKAGFYEEVNRAIRPEKKEDLLRATLGPLQRVAMTGERATGWITVTGYHLARRSDGIERKEADPAWPRRLHFRRLGGRWFLGE